MRHMIAYDPPAGEERITWLVVDPLQFTYLREGTFLLARRRGKPRFPAHLFVGYSEIRADAVGFQGRFFRRVWWLKEYDRDLSPEGSYSAGHPCEAVIPASIQVGRPSERFVD